VVGLHLVEEPDAAPLLLHVHEHAFALFGDGPQRSFELSAAVAAQGVQGVAGEAGRVDAYEDVVLTLRLTHHER
jgi:hypothetical protein